MIFFVVIVVVAVAAGVCFSISECVAAAAAVVVKLFKADWLKLKNQLLNLQCVLVLVLRTQHWRHLSLLLLALLFLLLLLYWTNAMQFLQHGECRYFLNFVLFFQFRVYRFTGFICCCCCWLVCWFFIMSFIVSIHIFSVSTPFWFCV